MADPKISNSEYLITEGARGAVDDASFRSKTARDAMENFQNDAMAIGNMLGGILKGVLGILGKGGGKGGKGGKGG